jgi:aspartyl-tRNA(Asn)/glutamyl-tRNA(Gln) amidotransferase subunit A
MALMNHADLAFASIEQIALLFRKRKLSPVELTKLMLSRIEQLNPKLNAYITVTPELALIQARKAESELFAARGRKRRRDRGLLHGIPISLKDNIYTAGIRTTAGSEILRDFVPERDAQVVATLKAAGAITLGKTNLHEFAYGVTTNNPHYGPARNPWDLTRIPGGSSGGSAAAVASGLCYASIGTDTGGSIRIPASLCGIVGLKPTLGQVSDAGIIPLSTTLDCIGPLARTTRDAAILFQAIGGRDTQERTGFSLPNLFKKLRKIRLGLPKEFFFDLVSAEVQSSFESTLRDFRKLGAQIKQVSIPLLNNTEDAGNHIAWPEATHFHQQSGWFPARSEEYGEDVRTRLEMGAKTSATAYLEALAQRARFIREMSLKMYEVGVDALVVPTTPIAAPRFAEESTRIGERDHPTRGLLLRLNRPANLAGVPAISIPCGFTSLGLPLGLQLIGTATNENLLLGIAQAFEHANPQKRRVPL